MSAVPHEISAVPHPLDRTVADAPWRARLAAALREVWQAMRAAHHERIPY